MSPLHTTCHRALSASSVLTRAAISSARAVASSLGLSARGTARRDAEAGAAARVSGAVGGQYDGRGTGRDAGSTRIVTRASVKHTHKHPRRERAEMPSQMDAHRRCTAGAQGQQKKTGAAGLQAEGRNTGGEWCAGFTWQTTTPAPSATANACLRSGPRGRSGTPCLRPVCALASDASRWCGTSSSARTGAASKSRHAE